MVDASLASPTHPSRPPPMTKSMDPFYFLSRPSEFLYTHIPLGDPHHQHVLSQEIIHPGIQLALPYACPAYFQHDLALQSDFDIAQTRLEGLQVACIDIEVPEDVECVAEVESQRRSQSRASTGTASMARWRATSMLPSKGISER
jgi:transglutaminase/protease-like cytokinesis protein 3